MSLRTKRYLAGGWLLLVVAGAALTQWLNASAESADKPEHAVWERGCPRPTPLPSARDGKVLVLYACARTDP